MKVFLFLIVSLVFGNLVAEAKKVDEKNGNITYYYDEDERTGNFPLKEPEKNCAKAKQIRKAAVQDTIRRCEAIMKEKCSIFSGSKDDFFPLIMSKHYISLANQPGVIGVDTDAYFFPGERDTASWYQKNCTDKD